MTMKIDQGFLQSLRKQILNKPFRSVIINAPQQRCFEVRWKDVTVL